MLNGIEKTMSKGVEECGSGRPEFGKRWKEGLKIGMMCLF